MDEFVKVALEQGFGYALFVFLLLYILKKQEQRDLKADERESGYQRIISELTDKLGIRIDKLESKIEDFISRK